MNNALIKIYEYILHMRAHIHTHINYYTF